MAGVVRFFFYGTLIDADVRRAVLGLLAPRRIESARLPGWRRVALPGKSYPAIVADPTASTEGVLVRGLNAVARRRLEHYEDQELYVVAEVQVVPTGRKRPVQALVFAAKQERSLRTTGPWDFDAWRRRHKPRFLLALGRRPAA